MDEDFLVLYYQMTWPSVIVGWLKLYKNHGIIINYTKEWLSLSWTHNTF